MSNKAFIDCPVCNCVTEQRIFYAIERSMHCVCMECHNKLIKNKLGTIVVANYNDKELSSGGVFFKLPEDVHRIF